MTFKSKVQSAISTKGEETKRAAEKDPNIKKVTRTLHDGRKETVLMKKSSLPTVKVFLLCHVMEHSVHMFFH